MNLSIHYYLTVFPLESLIASQLDPRQFGAYMASASKKGSPERLMFIELQDSTAPEIDWDYARSRCVEHANGDPKHSVYLSVYRALEMVPFEALGALYLTTVDGRVLELQRKDEAAQPEKPYYLYQELCPIQPLVVSALQPESFAQHICNPLYKVSVPKIVFADCKIPDLNDPENTGNIGMSFARRSAHLMECIAAVGEGSEKTAKTFDRSNISSFTFQLIDSGIYASNGKTLAYWAMPNLEQLKELDYDWARSANII